MNLRTPILLIAAMTFSFAANAALAQDAMAHSASSATSPNAMKGGSMGHDAMQGESMSHDSMKHDAMKPDSMKHDSMKHDAMKPDSMKHDSMKAPASAGSAG